MRNSIQKRKTMSGHIWQVEIKWKGIFTYKLLTLKETSRRAFKVTKYHLKLVRLAPINS